MDSKNFPHTPSEEFLPPKAVPHYSLLVKTEEDIEEKFSVTSNFKELDQDLPKKTENSTVVSYYFLFLYF